jgi:2-keto-4-pentenoate hydratase/2-oxohepta-3-ene-1,7-dioic acid hydratase in catechol pathway
MRYISFRIGGRSSYGFTRGRSVVDLGARVGDLIPDLRQYLDALARGFTGPHVPGLIEDYTLDDLEFLPVCQPGKIVCVGLNYDMHRLETGRTKLEFPTLFSRFADTLIGEGAPIVHPQVSSQLDFEGELAVVIGRPAHRVSRERALEFVAGYACFNDASLRDWQRRTSQFHPGKNFPSTAPFGPTLVTPDEVGPLRDLTIETRLNGSVMQSATLGQMIFSVEALIAYISAFTPLSPGDMIATGTPGGVGYTREPPVFMKPGDTIEVSIERVGHLTNGITDESAPEA